MSREKSKKLDIKVGRGTITVKGGSRSKDGRLCAFSITYLYPGSGKILIEPCEAQWKIRHPHLEEYYPPVTIRHDESLTIRTVSRLPQRYFLHPDTRAKLHEKLPDDLWMASIFEDDRQKALERVIMNLVSESPPGDDAVPIQAQSAAVDKVIRMIEDAIMEQYPYRP